MGYNNETFTIMPLELQLVGKVMRDYPECWHTNLDQVIRNLISMKEFNALKYATELSLIQLDLTVKLFLLHRPKLISQSHRIE